MSAYDAATLAAGAQLTAFSEPPDGLGAAPQAIDSLPTAAASSATQTQSVMSDAQLMSSLFQSFGLSPSSSLGLSPMEMLSMTGEFALQPMSMLMSQLVGQFMGGANPLMSGALGGMPSMGSMLASASSAVGTTSPSQLGAPAVLADVGRAGSVGALSVPPSWATEVQATSSTGPVAGLPPTGVSQVTPSLPRVPFKPPVTTGGRGVAGVTPAAEASRSGVVARPVVG
jgi:hypothetical protein